MKREDLLRLLNKYSAYNDREKEFKNQTIIFLSSNDIFLGRSNPEGHITASAWIVSKDRNKVLLNHHGKLNIWMPLGGHTEPGEDICEGAFREAKEESGLNSIKFISKDIFYIEVYKIPERKNEKEHMHFDISFLFEADSREKVIVSDESKDVKWVEIKKIKNYTQLSGIMTMIEKTQLYLPSRDLI